MEANGKPSSLTANQVTNTLTASPTHGPAIKPAAHTATIRSLSQPLREKLASSTKARAKNTNNAVPRSRFDSKEHSCTLKPGTNVNTNAAVTNTQMSFEKTIHGSKSRASETFSCFACYVLNGNRRHDLRDRPHLSELPFWFSRLPTLKKLSDRRRLTEQLAESQ
jgi:hypothetical protein